MNKQGAHRYIRLRGRQQRATAFRQIQRAGFKLCKLGEHTADGYGLGFHSVAPCGVLFVILLIGVEAVGVVVVSCLGDGKQTCQLDSQGDL